MNYEVLKINVRDNILTVEIAREKQLNALNGVAVKELHEVILNAQENILIKGIIITGSGEKSFVAGADIREFIGLNQQQASLLAQTGHEKLFNLIENSKKPVIAAINGYALGGGLELALACHIRIAAESAKFGFPELNLGIIPGYGGTQRLPLLIGKGRAFEMILTTDMIGTEQALNYGLVNKVVPFNELQREAREFMLKILSKSPEAISAAIIAINSSHQAAGFSVEISQFSKCFETKNFKEGVDAFLNKRRPEFT